MRWWAGRWKIPPTSRSTASKRISGKPYWCTTCSLVRSFGAAERAAASGARQRASARGAGILRRSERVQVMEFRRIDALPAVRLRHDRRAEDGGPAGRRGRHRPRVRQPRHPVARPSRSTSSREAARNPRNHRYSASRGIPKLRLAITDLYQRRFGVELDPETEACTTIGAKEGFSHLMWVLLGPGDAALVPSPSYPIHIWGPIFAGAERPPRPPRARSRTSSPTCSRRGRSRGPARG